MGRGVEGKRDVQQRGEMSATKVQRAPNSENRRLLDGRGWGCSARSEVLDGPVDPHGVADRGKAAVQEVKGWFWTAFRLVKAWLGVGLGSD